MYYTQSLSNFNDATNNALALTTAADGSVWIYDSTSRSIKQYQPLSSGLYAAQSFTLPGAVNYTTASLAEDPVSHDIYAYFRSGVYKYLCKISGGALVGYSTPTDALWKIKLDADGHLWGLVNGSIREYSTSGAALSLLENITVGSATSASAFDIDALGNIWFTSGGGSNDLNVISGTDHANIRLVAPGIGVVRSLEVNDLGSVVWLAVQSGLSEVSSGGIVKVYFTDPVAATGAYVLGYSQLNVPRSISIDGSNNLWVASTSTSGLREFVLDDVSTAISSMVLSSDTGQSATDFITSSAIQSISGTYSGYLFDYYGDTLQISLDNGSSWISATADGYGNWTLPTQNISADTTILARVQNFGGNTGPVFAQAYVIDTALPTVTTVVVPSNGTYAGGQSLDFTVNFDEVVIVDTSGGTPYLALILETGGTVHASYVSGSGSSALVFRYTVQSGEADPNGITLVTISTNGGTIQDLAGNDAVPALNSVGDTSAVLVDTLPPTITVASVAFSADTGTSIADLVTQTATQNISGTLSANLGAGELVQVSLDDGTSWVNATAALGQNTWTLAGQTLLGSNTLKVRLEDVSGNAGAVSSYAYTLDQAAPSADVAVTSLDIGSNVTTAQSSELGLVYLVDATAAITDLASLTALVTGGLASQANITALSTNTSLSTTGLSAGVYKVYAVDAAGNVSAASVNDITLTSPVAVGGGSAPSPVFDLQVVNGVGGSLGVMLVGDRFSSGSYDHVTGSGGNDTLIGYLGNDTLVGGSGFDEIRGGQGNDSLQGGLNADTLFGGRGNDMLEGGRGQDALYGGIGRDTLSGGVGNDLLTGGAGSDIFIFISAIDGLSNIDVITDFVSGVDQIQLSVSVFTALAEQVGQTVGLSQYITYNEDTGELLYDGDGSGLGSARAFAVLGTEDHLASISIDFWIVA